MSDSETRELTAALDDLLAAALPHMTEEQIRTLFEERLKEVDDRYQDFLSLPDS